MEHLKTTVDQYSAILQSQLDEDLQTAMDLCQNEEDEWSNSMCNTTVTNDPEHNECSPAVRTCENTFLNDTVVLSANIQSETENSNESHVHVFDTCDGPVKEFNLGLDSDCGRQTIDPLRTVEKMERHQTIDVIETAGDNHSTGQHTSDVHETADDSHGIGQRTDTVHVVEAADDLNGSLGHQT